MEVELPDGVEIVIDPSPAGWLVERLWHPYHPDRTVRVGAIIPEGFEAYARLFHPLRAEDGSLRRWAEVARARNKVAHHEMQFHSLMGSREPLSAYDSSWHPPDELPERQCRALALVLARFSSTSDRSWFCVWNGYGGLPRWPDVVGTPRSDPNFRRYVLMRGPLKSVMRFHFDGWWRPPNIWWPDDRAWCVATEIDYHWTYVGGSRACIDAVLASPELEALETSVDARADAAGDALNG